MNMGQFLASLTTKTKKDEDKPDPDTLASPMINTPVRTDPRDSGQSDFRPSKLEDLSKGGE